MNANIQALLDAQKQELKENSFNQLVEIADYNEKRFNEITSKIKEVIKKEVWNEFSFGSTSGKILGILRTLNFEFKHRDVLCKELGINPMLVDAYYKFAGNAPYLGKEGSVVSARPMDINKTKELVKIVGTQLGIIISKSDLDMINNENENIRNISALTRAETTKNSNFTTNIMVNNNGSRSELNNLLSDAEKAIADM